MLSSPRRCWLPSHRGRGRMRRRINLLYALSVSVLFWPSWLCSVLWPVEPGASLLYERERATRVARGPFCSSVRLAFCGSDRFSFIPQPRDRGERVEKENDEDRERKSESCSGATHFYTHTYTPTALSRVANICLRAFHSHSLQSVCVRPGERQSAKAPKEAKQLQDAPPPKRGVQQCYG